MYVIQLIGLYQKDGINAYYREQGKHCFDFVHSIEFATKFESEDNETIDRFKVYNEWYKKQYNAKSYKIVNIKDSE